MKSVFNKTVLDNGIRVVTERLSPFRSISIGFWVNVGSRDERPPESGISHFIEHMVFKGTKKRTAPEIAQSLESLGGHLNAFTGREQTCYYARVLDEHLPVAVDVLADLIKNSLLTPTDLEKEKKVILEEIKDVEDNPSDFIHDLYAQTLWKGQSLGQPVVGSVKLCRISGARTWCILSISTIRATAWWWRPRECEPPPPSGPGGKEFQMGLEK